MSQGWTEIVWAGRPLEDLGRGGGCLVVVGPEKKRSDLKRPMSVEEGEEQNIYRRYVGQTATQLLRP